MAVSLVRQTTGSSASSASATAAVPASTVGNLLVAFVARSGGLGTGALTGVADSAGQTWTLATRGAVSGGANTRIECWYVADSASVTSVTFSSGTAQVNAWNVLEFTGAATAPLDVVSPDNSSAAASTSIATPSVTTTVDGDLVLAAIHYTQTSGVLATAGFTALTDYDYTATGSGRAAYLAGAPVGGYSATWTLGAAQAAGVMTVTFKAAAGVSVAPVGVAVPVSVGSPSVAWTATVGPDGIAVPMDVGAPAAVATSPGGVVTRPDTGTTGRPADGTTARPYAGVTTRTSGITARPFAGSTARP